MLRDFWRFLMENKLWWITPTVVIFLALIALVYMTGDGAIAPFIYTLF